MSNYKSFEDLNETYLLSTSEKILREIWSIYRTKIRSFDDYCLLLENSIKQTKDRELTLNNIKIHFNKLSNEFYSELILLITSDSNLANPFSIKSEIYTLENIIEDLNDTHQGTIKSEAIIDFIQNDCKPLLKVIYSALKERVSNAYLSNESKNSFKIENKSKVKSYFDTDLDLKDDKIFKNLTIKLIENKFIKETHKYTALVNIFQDENQKIKWIGTKNELIWFVTELKLKGIIKDKEYWKIVGEIFIGINGQKFKALKRINEDEVPKAKIKSLKLLVENMLA